MKCNATVLALVLTAPGLPVETDGVMTVRTEAEIAAPKAQVNRVVAIPT